MGGGGGFDYLASAEGLVDQWQFFLGVWAMLVLWKAEMAWMVILGLFACITFVFIILKIAGVNLPKMLLLVYYIIGAIAILLVAIIISALCNNYSYSHMCSPSALSLSMSMGVFFIYGAVLAQAGK